MLVYSPIKITARREELDLNQSELARKAKLSAPTIWALEEGRIKMPKFQTLKSVASALGVPLQAIMADDQPADILEHVLAAATALEPKNRATLLAVAKTLLDSQKRK